MEEQRPMVVVTHNFPTAANLMAGLFVRDHVQRLETETGQQVQVLHIPFGGLMTAGDLMPWRWPRMLAYLWKAARLIQKADDRALIICHWFIPLGWLAAALHKSVRVVCHGTDLLMLSRFPFIAWLLRPFARRVFEWQVVSDHLKNLLMTTYSFISPDIIDVQSMPVGSAFRNEHKPRQPLYLSIGGEAKLKGHIRAIDWVAENDAASELTVIGLSLGKVRSQLEMHAAKNDLRITVEDVKPQEYLAEQMNIARGLITLHDHEGYCLVVREARECGCSVIGYIGDGRTKEVVDLVVPRG